MEYAALVLVFFIAATAVLRVRYLEIKLYESLKIAADLTNENRRLLTARVRERDKNRDVLEAEYIEEKTNRF